MFSSVKHIFFDLDDTLWDFEKNSSAVLEDLFSELGLASKLNTDFSTFHVTYKNVNSDLWRAYYKKEIDKQFLRNNRFDIVFKKFNYYNFSENLLATDNYLARSPYGMHLKDGCLETLNYLKSKYTLHIITNGFKEVQYIKLNNCGLNTYFTKIIVSDEQGLTKPDTEIFRLAESMASCKPEDCVMIGDNYESDVEGAISAGWKAIYFNDEIKPNSSAGTIQNLRELMTFL